MSCVGNKLTSVGLLTRHFNLACRDDFGQICTNYVSRPWKFTSAASIQLKGLILAQNERWRRGLGMQVEREDLKRYFG